MTSATLYSAYDIFAHINHEDKSWGEASQSLLPIIEKLLLKNIPVGGNILDICCGSGELVQKLQEKGYDVTGLDGSKEMLKYAKINAPESKFVLDDARFFKLPTTFDAVVSTQYGLNHILSIDELKSVFKNVYEALRLNGWFMFDLRLNERYHNTWNNSMAGDVKEEYAWALKRIYNSDTKIGEIHITIFQLINEMWQRLDDTWLVKGYYSNEVVSALQEVGFTEIGVYSAEEDFGDNQEVGTAYFVCCKPVN